MLAPMTQKERSMSRSEINRPSWRDSRFTPRYASVTPWMLPCPTFFPAYQDSPCPRILGAASVIDDTDAANADASARLISAAFGSMNWGAVRTSMTSVPRASNSFRACSFAISPSETMAMTEEMPIMMPTRPRMVRSRARRKLLTASRVLAARTGRSLDPFRKSTLMSGRSPERLQPHAAKPRLDRGSPLREVSRPEGAAAACIGSQSARRA